MKDLIKGVNDALKERKIKQLAEGGDPFAMAELEARKLNLPEGKCGSENEEVNIADFGNADLEVLADEMLKMLEDGDASDFDDAAVAVLDQDKRFDDISDTDADKMVERMVNYFTKVHGEKYGVKEGKEEHVCAAFMDPSRLDDFAGAIKDLMDEEGMSFGDALATAFDETEVPPVGGPCGKMLKQRVKEL